MLYWILLFLAPVLASSPSNGYAPGKVNCPAVPSLTRSASSGLSPNETQWLEARHQVADPQLAAFLKANLRDFDVDSFVADKHIHLALTFSGGSLRAMYSGAGQLDALDSRSSGSSPLKGLLQASTYIGGLSGGSWLVGSLALQDFPSVESVLAQGKLWDASNSAVNPYGLNIFSDTAFYANIGVDVLSKQGAGFMASLTDVWGRALSHQLFNTYSDDGSAATYSDIAASDDFNAGKYPFPIVVADGRAPGTEILNFNSTVFEINPYEIGSWDPSLAQFSALQYLGTKVNAGVPQGDCVAGYDNVGFVVGTSSSTFNQLLTKVDSGFLPSVLKSLISAFSWPYSLVDVAYYAPNPFYASNGTSSISQASTLSLVDGGEDTQNVPIGPFVAAARDVDVLVVHDNSNDHLQWPDGTALIASYQRQFTPQGRGSPFPYVPDQATFRNLNLTAKPTFFGCDAKNLSSLTANVYDVPLVVYLANRPFTYWSNTSTFKLTYSTDERQGMIDNGYQVSSRDGGFLDPEWGACVACALIRRQQERAGQDQTDQCKKCFQRYCWNGDIYHGSGIGENFSPDGRTFSPEYYNDTSIQGWGNGGDSF